MFIFNQKSVYSASSIFRNFIDRKDVEVNWFKLMDYYEDPKSPWFDHWPDEEEWSTLIAGYRKLDKRERWIARLYISELFPEHFLECLKSFVEDHFKSSVVFHELSLPIRFKHVLSRKEHVPYLFMSNVGNTIFFEPDVEKEDGLFFEFCGLINFNDTNQSNGIPDLQRQIGRYIKRLKRSRN